MVTKCTRCNGKGSYRETRTGCRSWYLVDCTCEVGQAKAAKVRAKLKKAMLKMDDFQRAQMESYLAKLG